jgi:hypothetical protein
LDASAAVSERNSSEREERELKAAAKAQRGVAAAARAQLKSMRENESDAEKARPLMRRWLTRGGGRRRNDGAQCRNLRDLAAALSSQEQQALAKR